MKKILFIILVMGLIFIAGCSQQSQDVFVVDDRVDDSVGDPVVDDTQSDVLSTGEVKEFEIIAQNWEFVPDTIEVNLGDKVELHIESMDVAHGFRLPEFGINERLEPHADVHVEFIADKKGTFPFSCSVPCGSGHGRMSGQLIVR